MAVTTTELYCVGCRQAKPVAAFTRERRTLRGYAKHCKACEGARRSARQAPSLDGRRCPGGGLR